MSDLGTWDNLVYALLAILISIAWIYIAIGGGADK